MTKNSSKLKKILRPLLILISIILLAILAIFVYFNAKINNYMKMLTLDENKLNAAYLKPRVLASDGNDISSFKFSSTASLSSLSDYTKNAFISIEDKKFYSHSGINFGRIAKAFLTNIKSGSFKEGGSTISQQLIKNAFLSSEKSIDRKLKEIALTKKLEQTHTKDEILEIYLNTIYFGNNIFGIENASKAYFGKSAKDLNLNESACLAGIIKSPNYYSNLNNTSALFERKNLVLSEMLKDGKISQNEFDESSKEMTKLKLTSTIKDNEAYQNATVSEACAVLNLSEQELMSSGYTIKTYFDSSAQKALNSAFNEQNVQYNFGGIILDNESSGVIALSSNLATFAGTKRQAGSTIKPILVYAPAIESGNYLPESFILDEEINIDGYSPKNASDNYSGFVTLDKALSKSLNVPAVKLFHELGADTCKNTANKFGINLLDDDDNPSLALGSSKNGQTLLGIVSAYSVLANNGIKKQPHFIKEIVDKNGIVVYRLNSNETHAISTETSYLVTKMLKNCAKSGTAKILSSLDFEVASKTGTVGSKNSNKNSDAYNIAYTTKHTFGIWVGSDNNEQESLMPKEINGSTLPTKIMKEVLTEVYKSGAPNKFTRSEGIDTVKIDATEYETNHKILLASENAPDRFVKEIEKANFTEIQKSPNTFEDSNQPLTLDAKTDLFSRKYIFR